MPGPQRIEPEDPAPGGYDLDRARDVFARARQFLRRCVEGVRREQAGEARALLEDLRLLDPAVRPEPARDADQEPPPSIQRRQSA